MTRQEINAALFVHEQLPSEFCRAGSPLANYGITRILECNDELVKRGYCKPGQKRVGERIAYCKPQIKNYFGIRDSELEELLKKAGVKD